MNFDFAIIYFGLTRSIKKVYNSHYNNIFNVLKNNNLTYKIFMHTWKTKNDEQRILRETIDKKIDYEEYKLLNPDYYKLEDQDIFTESINMDNYFFKDIFNKNGYCADGEWPPELILNHICALQSQKRGLEMVEDFVKDGNTFKYVMFIRPDSKFKNPLLIKELNTDKEIIVPKFKSNEGYNDRFAIIKYDKAHIYGKRINELHHFRKENGRIVSEKYLKFIINKYNLNLQKIKFKFISMRP